MVAPRELMSEQISRDELKKLLDQGFRYGEIAEKLGCSYSSVAHIARELGYGRSQSTHKEALPWRLQERHKLAMPAQYLRDLSRLAQGLNVSTYRARGAIKWAEDLVERRLDVAYDPDTPPSPFCSDGGFYAIEAGDGGSHVAKVLQAAKTRAWRRRR